MKKILIAFVSALSLLALCACGGNSSAEPEKVEEPEEPAVEAVVDIFKIADKSESDVAAVLGEPTMSETGTFTLNTGSKTDTISNTYADGTEITFIDGKAVRITVYPPDGSPVENGAALIGLSNEQAKSPYYDSLEDYSWKDNTEFYSIQAFNNGDGTISYIYVITDEAYQ